MNKFMIDDYVEVINTDLYDEENGVRVGMRGNIVAKIGTRYVVALKNWRISPERLRLIKREEKEMNKVERHKQLCEKLNKIYEAKNHDYGDSFGKSYKEYGLNMPCIRLEDKLNRLKSINFNKTVKVSDESLIDTLMDLANYSIMTVLELELEKEGER